MPKFLRILEKCFFSFGEQLLVKTWNAQQICVMISALLDCDLAWYFQADRPVEMFSADTDIHIVIENK